MKAAVPNTGPHWRQPCGHAPAPVATAKTVSARAAEALTHIAPVSEFVRFRTISAPVRYSENVTADPSANSTPAVVMSRPPLDTTTSAAPATATTRDTRTSRPGTPRPIAIESTATHTG